MATEREKQYEAILDEITTNLTAEFNARRQERLDKLVSLDKEVEDLDIEIAQYDQMAKAARRRDDQKYYRTLTDQMVSIRERKAKLLETNKQKFKRETDDDLAKLRADIKREARRLAEEGVSRLSKSAEDTALLSVPETFPVDIGIVEADTMRVTLSGGEDTTNIATVRGYTLADLDDFGALIDYLKNGDPNKEDAIGAQNDPDDTAGRDFAWSIIYSVVFPRLLKYCNVLTKDDNEARVLAQNTMGAAYQKFDQFKPDYDSDEERGFSRSVLSGFTGWLKTSARNRFYTQKFGDTRMTLEGLPRGSESDEPSMSLFEELVADEASELGQSPLAKLEATSTEERLFTILEYLAVALPSGVKKVLAFKLYLIDGLTQGEIADQFGVVPPTISNYIDEVADAIETVDMEFGEAAEKTRRSHKIAKEKTPLFKQSQAESKAERKSERETYGRGRAGKRAAEEAARERNPRSSTKGMPASLSRMLRRLGWLV
jgi:DNA-directed RNA polymerase specialized sigma24 family protein